MKIRICRVVTLGLVIMGMLWACLGLAPASVRAADESCDPAYPQAVLEANGCFGNENAIPDVVTNILLSVILVSGLVALVFVVIGGVRYISSAGDAEKAKTGRKTILYALIGLVVSVLAFAIVNFTIRTLGDQGGNTDDTSEGTDSDKQAVNTVRPTIRIGSKTTISSTEGINTVRLRPAYDGDGTLTWKSSNPEVASVDASGKVTGHKKGKATITVSAPDGSKSEVEVTVSPPIVADSVSISSGDATINTGQKKTLNATVFPTNATNKTVKWSSSDKKVATVNKSGVVTAKKEGTVKITAETTNGKKASVNITVKPGEGSVNGDGPIPITQKLLSALKPYHQNYYTSTEYRIYSQKCGRYFYNTFGIGGGACGPAAYLAAAYALTNNNVKFMTFAQEAVETGLMNCEGGGSWDVVALSKKSYYEKKYGVGGRSIANSWDAVVKELKKGHVVVHLVSNPPSMFAVSTHFVVSMSYREDNGGQVYIWNPNNNPAKSKGNCDLGECWYSKSEFEANIVRARFAGPITPYAMYKISK